MTKKYYKNAGMEVPMDRAPFAVTHKQHIMNEYTVYLFGAIEDSNDFLGAIEVLNSATPDDIVRINLSSVGGSLSATDTLLFEILKAQERGIEVGVSASGLIASAGSLILLAATYFELSEDATVMLHCGSLGDGGTLNEFRTASAFHIRHMETIFKKHYRHFLTDDEIQQLLDGKDYWLTSSEFVARYQARNESINAEMENSCECGECEIEERDENRNLGEELLEAAKSVPKRTARKKPETKEE